MILRRQLNLSADSLQCFLLYKAYIALPSPLRADRGRAGKICIDALMEAAASQASLYPSDFDFAAPRHHSSAIKVPSTHEPS